MNLMELRQVQKGAGVNKSDNLFIEIQKSCEATLSIIPKNIVSHYIFLAN